MITPIVDRLVKQPHVHDRKIGLTGWSKGGNLVMRAALTEPRLAAVTRSRTRTGPPAG